MRMIYLLAFSPMARSVGAFLAGAYFIGDWWWHYKPYSRTQPYELYCGIFLVCLGALGAAVSYWLILRRRSRQNEARVTASTP